MRCIELEGMCHLIPTVRFARKHALFPSIDVRMMMEGLWFNCHMIFSFLKGHKSWRCENKAFVRDFLQILKVQVLEMKFELRSSTARPIREWSRFKRTCSAGRGVAFTRERLGEENRMYTRADRNYTQIGNGNFLLVKTNENRDWWYMGRFYLQPCVEVGGSRLLCGQDRNYTRIGNVFNVSYLSLSMYVCMYLSIYL